MLARTLKQRSVEPLPFSRPGAALPCPAGHRIVLGGRGRTIVDALPPDAGAYRVPCADLDARAS
jgi:hypothetical protein